MAASPDIARAALSEYLADPRWANGDTMGMQPTLQSAAVWLNSGPSTPLAIFDLRAFQDDAAAAFATVFDGAGYTIQARSGRSYRGEPLAIADLFVGQLPENLPARPVVPAKVPTPANEISAGAFTAGPGITLRPGPRSVEISAAAPPAMPVWFFSHAAPGDAGASIAGEQTRALNTSDGSLSGAATLRGDVITLQPGTYVVRGSAPAFSVGGHQAFLSTSPDFARILVGTTEHSGAGMGLDISASRSCFAGRVVVRDAPADFVVRHYTAQAHADFGLGVAAGSGAGEIYTTVEITQVA